MPMATALPPNTREKVIDSVKLKERYPESTAAKKKISRRFYKPYK